MMTADDHIRPGATVNEADSTAISATSGDEAATTIPDTAAEPPTGRAVLLPWVGAGLVIALMIGHTTNHLWAFDFWWYLSAVREFAEHGFAATHPLVTDATDDPYLNPYTFVLGFLTAIGWWEASTTLMMAGIANLLLLGLGLVRFARAVTGRAAAGPLLVVATLLLWGWSPWRFAGFFHLNALGYAIPLGSTLAAALALFLLTALRQWLAGDRGRNQLVTIGLCTPLVILIHPMTATWAAAIAAGFLLAAPLRERKTWFPVAAASGGALVTLLWPYYPVTELHSNLTAFAASNAAMFDSVLIRTLLALPGAAVLVVRLVRRQRDPLAIAFAVVAGLYVIAWVTSTYALGRVLPGVVLCAHLAMVDAGLGWWDRNPEPSRRGVAAKVIGAVVVVGALGVAPGAMRGVPRDLLPEPYRSDQRLASTITPALDALPGPIQRDDVMLTSRSLALPAAAQAGKILATPAGTPAPFFDPYQLRRRRSLISALLYSPMDDDERQGIIEFHEIRWLVLTPSEHESLRLQDWASAPPVVETDEIVVVRIGTD